MYTTDIQQALSRPTSFAGECTRPFTVPASLEGGCFFVRTTLHSSFLPQLVSQGFFFIFIINRCKIYSTPAGLDCHLVFVKMILFINIYSFKRQILHEQIFVEIIIVLQIRTSLNGYIIRELNKRLCKRVQERAIAPTSVFKFN